MFSLNLHFSLVKKIAAANNGLLYFVDKTLLHLDTEMQVYEQIASLSK